MDEQEQVVINLIVNSGSARSSAIEAIQYAKAGDLAKADESLQQAKETVNEAHHSQTELSGLVCYDMLKYHTNLHHSQTVAEHNAG